MGRNTTSDQLCSDRAIEIGAPDNTEFVFVFERAREGLSLREPKSQRRTQERHEQKELRGSPVKSPIEKIKLLDSY